MGFLEMESGEREFSWKLLLEQILGSKAHIHSLSGSFLLPNASLEWTLRNAAPTECGAVQK